MKIDYVGHSLGREWSNNKANGCFLAMKKPVARHAIAVYLLHSRRVVLCGPIRLPVFCVLIHGLFEIGIPHMKKFVVALAATVALTACGSAETAPAEDAAATEEVVTEEAAPEAAAADEAAMGAEGAAATEAAAPAAEGAEAAAAAAEGAEAAATEATAAAGEAAAAAEGAEKAADAAKM